jgi:hypothetical protein
MLLMDLIVGTAADTPFVSVLTGLVVRNFLSSMKKFRQGSRVFLI